MKRILLLCILLLLMIGCTKITDEHNMACAKKCLDSDKMYKRVAEYIANPNVYCKCIYNMNNEVGNKSESDN